VRDIVAFAASRHSRSSGDRHAGHAQAAIAATSARPTDGPPPGYRALGIHNYLFNVEPATFAFLENVLAEVMRCSRAASFMSRDER